MHYPFEVKPQESCLTQLYAFSSVSHLEIVKPNQVWAMDITYIPMAKGFVYLTCVMDIYSRKILSSVISNTLDAGFCVEAYEEAVSLYGSPEIINTDGLHP